MTEDPLEQEALDWLGDVGYSHLYGPDIAFDGPAPERSDYRGVLLVKRLRGAIAKLNPDISTAGTAVSRLTGRGRGVMFQQLFRLYANAVCSSLPVGKGLRISRIGARHPMKDMPSFALLFQGECIRIWCGACLRNFLLHGFALEVRYYLILLSPKVTALNR